MCLVAMTFIKWKIHIWVCLWPVDYFSKGLKFSLTRSEIEGENLSQINNFCGL